MLKDSLMAGGTWMGDRNSLAHGSRGQHGCPWRPPHFFPCLYLRFGSSGKTFARDRGAGMGGSAGSAQRQKSSELPLEASLKSFPRQPQCPFPRWSRHRGQAWRLDSCLLIPCLGHLFFNFYSPTPPPFLLPLFSAKMSPPQALPLALLWWRHQD